MKRIALFLCLLILVSSTSMAANKNKTKDVGKKAVTYSKEAISLDATSLPKNYYGHNLRDLYFALVKREYIMKQGKFETEADFIKRVETEEKKNKPLLGNLGIKDVYAFAVAPDTNTYNADEQYFSLSVGADPTIIDGNFRISFTGIKGPIHLNEVSYYKGTNAYGAVATIKKTHADCPVLVFNKKIEITSQYEYSKLNQWGDRYEFNIELRNISPQKAKHINHSLMFLLLFTLNEPFVNDGTYTRKPTIQEPDDMTLNLLYVFPKLKEIWVYNKSTGEIYSKIKVSSQD